MGKPVECAINRVQWLIPSPPHHVFRFRFDQDDFTKLVDITVAIPSENSYFRFRPFRPPSLFLSLVKLD